MDDARSRWAPDANAIAVSSGDRCPKASSSTHNQMLTEDELDLMFYEQDGGDTSFPVAEYHVRGGGGGVPPRTGGLP